MYLSGATFVSTKEELKYLYKVEDEKTLEIYCVDMEDELTRGFYVSSKRIPLLFRRVYRPVKMFNVIVGVGGTHLVCSEDTALASTQHITYNEDWGYLEEYEWGTTRVSELSVGDKLFGRMQASNYGCSNLHEVHRVKYEGIKGTGRYDSIYEVINTTGKTVYMYAECMGGTVCHPYVYQGLIVEVIPNN